MDQGSRSNPLEPIATHWQRNPRAPERSGNWLANRDKAGSRLPDRTNHLCKSTRDDRDSSKHPFKPREALIGASAKLHLRKTPLELERHYRDRFITCAYFTKNETSNPIGATSPENLKRHERSRATGQPSSQITLRPTSIIEKHCSKGPPGSAKWSIEAHWRTAM